MVFWESDCVSKAKSSTKIGQDLKLCTSSIPRSMPTTFCSVPARREQTTCYGQFLRCSQVRHGGETRRGHLQSLFFHYWHTRPTIRQHYRWTTLPMEKICQKRYRSARYAKCEGSKCSADEIDVVVATAHLQAHLALCEPVHSTSPAY